MGAGKKSKLLSLARFGIGMTAWGISLAAIFMPLLSEYGIWVALLLAAIHGVFGGILLPVLTLLTSLVNIFLLSPVDSMGISSIVITALLAAAVGGSIKHALKRRLLG